MLFVPCCVASFAMLLQGQIVDWNYRRMIQGTTVAAPWILLFIFGMLVPSFLGVLNTLLVD